MSLSGIATRTLAIIIAIVVVVAVVAAIVATMPAPAPTPTPTPTTPTPTTPTPTPTTPAPVKLESLITVAYANLPYLDPHVAIDEAGKSYVHNVYEGLLNFEYRGGKVEVVPWLAERYEVSPDGRVWTFYLRKGVKFHTGRVMTADDVMFSLMRLVLMPEGPGALLVPWVDLNASKKIDDYTVQIVLKRPCGVFEYLAAYIFVIDSTELKQRIRCPGPYGEWCDFGKGWLMEGYMSIGTGPYKLGEYVPGSHVLLVKFDDWWNKKEFAPRAPEKVKLIGPIDAPTTETMMVRRELDISSQWMPIETYMKLDQVEGIDIARIPNFLGYYIMFNTRRPPLDDVHVRKALAYLYDYESFLEIMPNHVRMRSIVPLGMIGACEVPELPEYNPEKALEELKKSKYWGELDKYTINIIWRAPVVGEDRVLYILAENAAKVGLKVQILKWDWLFLVEKMTRLEDAPDSTPMWVPADYPEAISLIYNRWHSASRGTYYQNEWFPDDIQREIDRRIEDILMTLNKEERLRKTCDLIQYIYSLYPSIFLGESTPFKAYQTYLDWPAARGEIVPLTGFDVEFWKMNLNLEQKARILGLA